ncbi:MAG: lysophospholipid acyltransferase family protein [Thermodesulfovibrionales bacterium]
MKKAVWIIEIGLFIVLSIPLAILPLRLALKVGDMLGLLLFHVWGSRRRIAIDNLSKCVSAGAIRITEPAKTIIRKNFINLGRSFIEVIKIYYGLGEKIIRSVRIEGLEHFKTAQSKGKGILLLSGHCGNWEILAIAMSLKISSGSGIARPINNPYVNKIIERVRRKYGNEVIYKKGALKPIMKKLKNNECIGILMDQAVIPEEGYVLDFLGRGAWTTKTPALIARKTEAAAMPVFMHRHDGGHTITLYPQVELSGNNDRETAVKEDTAKFSSYIENYIKEHPTEWLWIHRRWKRVNPY